MTTNKEHSAFEISKKHENEIDLPDLLKILKEKYQIEKLTIQSGGTLNSAWIREGLIDRISIVVAPCIVGGKTTPTLVDEKPLHEQKELENVKALKLIEANVLENSYLHLKYAVISETVIEL